MADNDVVCSCCSLLLCSASEPWDLGTHCPRTLKPGTLTAVGYVDDALCERDCLRLGIALRDSRLLELKGRPPTRSSAGAPLTTKAERIARGTQVRMSETLKASLIANGCADHVEEFGDWVGTVDGPTDYGAHSGPEVDVRWQPSGLRYAYAPEHLETTCARCLRPLGDCAVIPYFDNKAIIGCRDTEVELLKAQVERSKSVLRVALAQLDQAIAEAEPEVEVG